ncbi:MAG: GntR family transcriptional regulator [Ktedonobacteraceae bacterium]
MKSHVETITARIKTDILEGKVGQYNALPNRRALAAQFKTTVDTIAKVLVNLEVEGLVVKGSGRSMLVNTPKARVTTSGEIFRDVMAEEGHSVKVEHLATPGIIEASLEIARMLHIAPGTLLIERKRREIIDGVVYRYSRKFYLADLVPAESLAAMQADYTYNVRDVIEAQRPVVRIEERIFARAISDKAEAEILGTIKGAPVLEQWMLNYDEQKRVLWISMVVFNATRFVKRYDYAPEDAPKLSSFVKDENYE